MRPRLLVAAAGVLTLCACAETDDAARDATVDSAALAAAPPPAGSSVVKACDLVTEAELESILGIELEAARTTNDYAGDSQCRWALPGDAQRGVSISLRQNFRLENYAAAPGVVEVSGVGEGAVWNPTVSQLAVRKGTRVVSIALFVPDAQRALAERIAGIALDKI